MRHEVKYFEMTVTKKNRERECASVHFHLSLRFPWTPCCKGCRWWSGSGLSGMMWSSSWAFNNFDRISKTCSLYHLTNEQPLFQPCITDTVGREEFQFELTAGQLFSRKMTSSSSRTTEEKRVTQDEIMIFIITTFHKFHSVVPEVGRAGRTGREGGKREDQGTKQQKYPQP